MAADPAALAFEALRRAQVEFVVVGMSGINAFAPDPRDAFLTRDVDCLLPPDLDNLRRALLTLRSAGFSFAEIASDAVAFEIGGVEVRVGRLQKLLQAKKIAGRPKDLEFLRLFAARFRGRTPPE